MVDNHTFNLLTTPWLPALRASGKRETIRPADITASIDSDPIVEIDWPRPDFRGATLEFLIGLLTVACPPTSARDWPARWKAPPSTADLEAAFAPLNAAFAFEGEGPRAYQDLEELAAAPNRVEALLMEAPGEQGIKKNTTLLVKADRVACMSRPAAAIALLTLQTMAPAGGAGIRTSLRGGGPLMTLVVPAARASLWHRLWTNVPQGSEPAAPADVPRIFPWLVPTRTSGKDGQPTTPKDVDWRQAFFGIPRRIRLDFEPNTDGTSCDLTGKVDDFVVRGYRTRPGGTNYDAWGPRHPLTPHRIGANELEFIPIHGQDGRFGYRQWVAMLYGDKEGSRVPAACVRTFRTERVKNLQADERRFRLLASGYAFDKMKALAFVEAETPDIVAPETDPDYVSDKAKNFVAAANVVAGSVGYAVKMALYGEDADARISKLSDKTPLTVATERFWAETNDAFFTALNEISTQPNEALTATGGSPRGRAWLQAMHPVALAIFDETVPIQAADAANVKRVIEGRRFLLRTLLGYGKRGTGLFGLLELASPEVKGRKGGKGKAK